MIISGGDLLFCTTWHIRWKLVGWCIHTRTYTHIYIPLCCELSDSINVPPEKYWYGYIILQPIRVLCTVRSRCATVHQPTTYSTYIGNSVEIVGKKGNGSTVHKDTFSHPSHPKNLNGSYYVGYDSYQSLVFFTIVTGDWKTEKEKNFFLFFFFWRWWRTKLVSWHNHNLPMALYLNPYNLLYYCFLLNVFYM